MNRIILLTLGFPYGTSEPFLMDELPYHDDSILISSFIGKNPQLRDIKPSQVTVVRLNSPFFGGSKYRKCLSAIMAVTSPVFWKEMKSQGIRPLTLRKVLQLLACIGTAHNIVKETEKNLSEEILKDSCVYYAYWMNQLGLAAVMLAKRHKGLAVSRCHGYDLYERQENNYYVTCQEYLSKELDRVLCISQDGCNKIQSILKQDMHSVNIDKKVFLSRLGTGDNSYELVGKKGKEFLLVSCSNVVSLKRVEKIAEALSYLKDISIRWVHFGTGPLLDSLALKTRDLELSDVELKGYVPKEQIMEYYHSHYVALFINVSESEGIPVSIMEALSFGVPCIGTDVGGVKEIITQGENGYLLDVNSSNKSIADVIRKFYEMDDSDYITYRRNARCSWEDKYSAKKNYSSLIKMLKELKE